MNNYRIYKVNKSADYKLINKFPNSEEIVTRGTYEECKKEYKKLIKTL